MSNISKKLVNLLLSDKVYFNLEKTNQILMTFIPNSSLPNFIIFLDIDGVLRPQYVNHEEIALMDRLIYEKIGRDEFHSFSCKNCVTCDTALATLFDEEAVAAFEKLIAKIQKVANVFIVISSAWRKNRTVEELQKVFAAHKFSEYIVDKTIDCKLPFEEWTKECVVDHTQNFEPCRASQINKWLKSYHGYDGYLVFDDNDSHLSDNFDFKYISTDDGNNIIFKTENAKKAYKIALRQLGEDNGSSDS